MSLWTPHPYIWWGQNHAVEMLRNKGTGCSRKKNSWKFQKTWNSHWCSSLNNTTAKKKRAKSKYGCLRMVFRCTNLEDVLKKIYNFRFIFEKKILTLHVYFLLCATFRPFIEIYFRWLLLRDTSKMKGYEYVCKPLTSSCLFLKLNIQPRLFLLSFKEDAENVTIQSVLQEIWDLTAAYGFPPKTPSPAGE